MSFTREQFEKFVTESVELLPSVAKERISNVALMVENEPSEEDRLREGLLENETLFGLYKGVPLDERGSSYGIGMTLPDTITIYQKPIEEEARGDETLLKKIIAETVWHEFAHHMGMDEGEVQEKEWEREYKKEASA